MHAGNIFSALVAWLLVKSLDGDIVLRIEDLDRDRSKRKWVDRILSDLEALGITWDEGPIYQSDRSGLYEDAFQDLRELLYPCFCSRADLHALSAPHEGERFVYPGTCRHLSEEERALRLKERKQEGRAAAYRLMVPDETVAFADLLQGDFCQNLARDVGDFIVRRSDGAFSYQWAVAIDDAEMGIDMVVRGYDLLESTPQQIFLAETFGVEPPRYAHVPLICAPDGRRLAKRNQDAMMDGLIEVHGSPEGILGHLAYLSGLIDCDEGLTAEDLLHELSFDSIIEALSGIERIILK